ncbi:MAG: tRNA (adenosine(37)-N6)-threonylcarbamoyltransferase complex ATPase subunit type 1 TsaE [Ideonella sp.]
MNHPLILETRTLLWADEAACAAFAARLAAQPAVANACIELDGPLGAGKTTFVRHLLRALGVTGRIKSPTYAVVEHYELESNHGRLPVAHFDFYRFGDPREWEDAGFRDVFGQHGLKLCEWAQNAGVMRPQADLCLRIEPQTDEQRVIQATASTPTGVALLA